MSQVGDIVEFKRQGLSSFSGVDSQASDSHDEDPIVTGLYYRALDACHRRIVETRKNLSRKLCYQLFAAEAVQPWDASDLWERRALSG